jgi:hypothetical protein
MCMPGPSLPPQTKMPEPPPPPMAPPPPSATAAEVVKGKDRDIDQTNKKKRLGTSLRISRADSAANAPGLNIAN